MDRVDLGRRIAAPRLKGGGQVGEQVDPLEIVPGVGAGRIERLESLAEVVRRLHEGGPPERAGSGLTPVRHRLGRLGGTGPMVRHDLRLTLDHRREVPGQHLRDTPVEVVPATAQEPLVGRLLQEGMRELPAGSRPVDRP